MRFARRIFSKRKRTPICALRAATVAALNRARSLKLPAGRSGIANFSNFSNSSKCACEKLRNSCSNACLRLQAMLSGSKPTSTCCIATKRPTSRRYTFEVCLTIFSCKPASLPAFRPGCVSSPSAGRAL